MSHQEEVCTGLLRVSWYGILPTLFSGRSVSKWKILFVSIPSSAWISLHVMMPTIALPGRWLTSFTQQIFSENEITCHSHFKSPKTVKKVAISSVSTVGWIIALQRCLCPNPQSLRLCHLTGKRNFADII